MVVLTRLEEMLLMTIWRLKGNAYGVAIKKEVHERAGKKFTIGALYFALDQLFKKGYVSKTSGEPTPERGGRSKTYYTITKLGEEGLQNALEIHNSLWSGVSDVAFNSGEKS